MDRTAAEYAGQRPVNCPRYCEIFGPGACAGVFDESRCVMRRAAKVDDNQGEIVAALQRAGCSVQSLAGVGRGFPDLAVGFQGRCQASAG